MSAVIVNIDWQDFYVCCNVGLRRQIFAFSNRLAHYGNPDGTEPVFEQHIAAAISEFAVARTLNLFWEPSVGRIESTDVGGIVEVRVRNIPGTGTDLAIRPKDDDEKPFVLVHLYRDRPWRPELIGWLFGWEGKRKDVPPDPKRGVWFNAPPYRAIKDLMCHVEAMRR